MAITDYRMALKKGLLTRDKNYHTPLVRTFVEYLENGH